MRVLIVKGLSQYGGTRLFADEAAAAFQRRGDVAQLVDLGGADRALTDLWCERSGGFDLVFSMNILGEARDLDGRTVAEAFGCPHVVWHTDYILTASAKLEQTPANTRMLVVDPTQIEAVKAAFGNDRFSSIRFFPHPAVGSAAPDAATVQAFDQERPIPILWTGGFVKPRRPWASAPEATRRAMDAAVEMSLSVEWMPPHEAWATALKSTGVDATSEASRRSLQAASLIDAEVRETRRHAFLIALAKSGLPVHICGAGWEPHLYRFKNAVYHGEVDLSEVVELMRRSRIVLNTNGNFGAGSHERPFTASLAGAATVSDFSLYYDQVFDDGENIELFRWRELAEAMDKIRRLSMELERCFEFARSAKAVTVAGHTWDRQIGLIAGD